MMINLASRLSGRSHITRKLSAFYRNDRLSTRDYFVKQRRFADLRSNSRSSGSHLGRAAGSGELTVAGAAVVNGSARRWLDAFATALSSGAAGFNRELWVGIVITWRTASPKTPWFGCSVSIRGASWRRGSKLRKPISATIWEIAAWLESLVCGESHNVDELGTSCWEIK